MSNPQPQKQQPVYHVTVKVDGVTKFIVIAADNKSQAIRKAAEGIIDARIMTPFEVLSWAENQQKRNREELAASLSKAPSFSIDPEEESVPLVGGLPVGDQQ